MIYPLNYDGKEINALLAKIKNLNTDGFVSRAEMNEAISKATGANIDLTPYAKVADVREIYATKAELTAAINNIDMSPYARISDISATYATKTYVANQIANITGVDLSGYLTIVDANSTYMKIADMTSYAKTLDISTTYATKSALQTEIANLHIEEYAKTADISNVYASKAYVASELAKVSSGGSVDLSGYLTIVDANSTFLKIADLTSKLTEYAKTADIATTYATKAELNDAIAGIGTGGGTVDLTGYAKLTDVDDKIKVAMDNMTIDVLSTADYEALDQTAKDDPTKLYILNDADDVVIDTSKYVEVDKLTLNKTADGKVQLLYNGTVISEC